MNSKRSMIILIIIILLICIMPGSITKSIPIDVAGLFFIIGIVSVMGIIQEYRHGSYSLNMIHWFYFLIFFFVAPIIQATFEFRPWGISMDADQLRKSCFLILLWIFFYVIGIAFGNRILLHFNIKEKIINQKWLFVYVIISIGCALILISRVGFQNVFTRAEMESANVSYHLSTAASLILDKCSRAAIVFTEVILLIRGQYEKRDRYLLFFHTAILLLACFPTGLSRNATGIIYLGLLVVYWYRKKDSLRTSPFYILLFLIAIIVLFPLINVFRTLRFDSPNLMTELAEILTNLRYVYISGDYDGFAMLTAANAYVLENGISFGRQLIGAMLFFIPRSIWNAKPIGSGAMIAYGRGMTFTNISCPLVAEGVVNFGIVGVALFSFVAGASCRALDRKYWETMRRVNSFNYFIIIYPFLLPCYFFVLRGDLLSSWSYTFAYIFTFLFLFNLSGFRIKKN